MLVLPPPHGEADVVGEARWRRQGERGAVMDAAARPRLVVAGGAVAGTQAVAGAQVDAAERETSEEM